MATIQLDSADDLESLALELGGSATHKNGRVFNASGRTGVARLPVRSVPAPVPAPTPLPPPADTNADLLAKMVELLARPIPEPTQAPAAAAPSVIVQPAPKTAWEFKFHRNPDGTISSITATPKD